MLRKASEAVPEGNDPVPRKEELESGQPTMEDVYRMMKEAFDRWDKKLDEISDEMKKMDLHVTRLEHGARQPRVPMEADEQASTTTASVRRAPQQQYKQCVGTAFLYAGFNPAQPPTRPLSA